LSYLKRTAVTIKCECAEFKSQSRGFLSPKKFKGKGSEGFTLDKIRL